ncbi:MAG: deoxyribonuclease-1 [Arenicella sp.]|jgi:deoxyribonuclease-1
MTNWFYIAAICVLLVGCENDSQSAREPSQLGWVASSDTNANAQPDRRAIKDYDTARPLLWRSVYPNGGETLYCGERFDSQYREGYNVEHVFPMSWATNGLNCGKRKQCRARSEAFNRIEADLHNLFPSRSDVNQDRSSYRFGDVPGEQRRYGSKCDFEVSERKRVAEPAPDKRGEVARAMFYMADKYKADGLVLFQKQALLLERWHRADPPSDEERRRNNLIEGLQGNRNLFIDAPDKLHLLIKSGYFFN